MLAEDGTARIQILPSSNLKELEDFRAFVEDVAAFAPNSAGVPRNLVEFGIVTKSSFQQALISAFVMISLLLFLLWRNLIDVVLVMAPLTLGAMLTGASMAVFDIRFNFTNVVVIPLLFGIGVDSGIHLVQRAKEGLLQEQGLMGTATARAVYYSALTTSMSFGSMSLAGHNGLKSLGIMLTVGLVFTVRCVC